VTSVVAHFRHYDTENDEVSSVFFPKWESLELVLILFEKVSKAIKHKRKNKGPKDTDGSQNFRDLMPASLLQRGSIRVFQILGISPRKARSANYYLAVWQFVALLQRGRGSGGCHLMLKVQGHVTQFFLDVAYDLALGGGRKGVTPLGQDLHQVICQIATSQIQAQDSVR